MRIWNDKDEYIYMGQDGIVFLYRLEKVGWINTPDGPRQGGRVDLMYSMPKAFSANDFDSLLRTTEKAVRNRNYELYLTGIGRFEFDNEKQTSGKFPPVNIIIPSEEEGRVIIYSNMKDEQMTRTMLINVTKQYVDNKPDVKDRKDQGF